ncbi:MAG: hypothetical protein JWO13_2573 [Acidobacteriales bacterium]|nr:hypothetical protein [Terriglobales bacterium]
MVGESLVGTPMVATAEAAVLHKQVQIPLCTRNDKHRTQWSGDKQDGELVPSLRSE